MTVVFWRFLLSCRASCSFSLSLLLAGCCYGFLPRNRNPPSRQRCRSSGNAGQCHDLRADSLADVAQADTSCADRDLNAILPSDKHISPMVYNGLTLGYAIVPHHLQSTYTSPIDLSSESPAWLETFQAFAESKPTIKLRKSPRNHAQPGANVDIHYCPAVKCKFSNEKLSNVTAHHEQVHLNKRL